MAAEPVVAALAKLAEGGGGGSLSTTLVKSSLPEPLAAFLLAHLPEPAADGGVAYGSFDPFPYDQAAPEGRPLPERSLDNFTHGFAVIEHLNKARTDPPAFAALLAESLKGCFDGKKFAPPWGGKYLLQEGEAAFQSLLQTLQSTKPMAAVTLSEPVCAAAQALANAIGGGTNAQPPALEERLKGVGRFSGIACEAVLTGVRGPLAIVTMLLISDGDAQRQFRSFLLHPDIRVGGFGLAEGGRERECTGTLTLLQLFAPALAEPTTVVCEAGVPPSAAFHEVLNAVPSEEFRKQALDALAAGKKVVVKHELTSVDLTTTEASGAGQTMRLQFS